jgi:hypothetical protein
MNELRKTLKKRKGFNLKPPTQPTQFCSGYDQGRIGSPNFGGIFFKRPKKKLLPKQNADLKIKLI